MNAEFNEKITQFFAFCICQETVTGGSCSTRERRECLTFNAQDRDSDDQSLLHWAQGEEEEVALEHGADVNALDIEGQTTLHQVSEGGRVRTSPVILDHSLDVNPQDANNATCLYIHLASGVQAADSSHSDVDISYPFFILEVSGITVKHLLCIVPLYFHEIGTKAYHIDKGPNSQSVGEENPDCYA